MSNVNLAGQNLIARNGNIAKTVQCDENGNLIVVINGINSNTRVPSYVSRIYDIELLQEFYINLEIPNMASADIFFMKIIFAVENTIEFCAIRLNGENIYTITDGKSKEIDMNKLFGIDGLNITNTDQFTLYARNTNTSTTEIEIQTYSKIVPIEIE